MQNTDLIHILIRQLKILHEEYCKQLIAFLVFKGEKFILN
jgi:hypothetical protein